MLQLTSVAMRVMLMGSKCLRVDVTWYLLLYAMCLSHHTKTERYMRSVKCDLKLLVLLQAAAMMRRLKASCMDSVPHSTSSGTILSHNQPYCLHAPSQIRWPGKVRQVASVIAHMHILG